MAVELIGAKLIAPWFGTSLYVWTSVLGVSMLGLASGYYLGGYWSRGRHHAGKLKMLLILSAAVIALMPTSARLVMTLTQLMDVRWGSLISSLIFIFPPLLFMGMVSPMIIRYCAVHKAQTGRVAGLVFAASTVGGVLSVLLTGFYLIPVWGLYDTPWLFAGLMLGATMIVKLLGENISAA